MTTARPLAPVTLEGAHVRLEPLTLDHQHELCDVGLDPELWRWTVAAAATPEELGDYIATALQERSDGTALPFLIREKSTGRAIGSTRYGNIDLTHRRLEIGWTWLGSHFQRTPMNTEAKLLLLTHAFEVLGCIRVEFKTDALNTKSRNALKRIGAIEEGTLRSHFITASGRIRDTVYYSILEAEWPAVKAALQARLNP